ncbi:heme o synthase [Halocalculus aciditolerans]|uniref:Protoheme IX farnesyltransferase n=1 Tax=Halocalculus aciditolerans TaxID=1383812 RepID=A0A830FJI3_9EURY|nr:heme o synthase [Halocalculus aciditolerans]GGL61438.1 protoheme IX farnesyltransferase [Halocalculus aciditolerans]
MTSRFVGGLAAAICGVYALIVVGATESLTGAAAACPTWPSCNGAWLQASSANLSIVWAHRVATVVVGLVVLAVVAWAWLRDEPRRVRFALLTTVALYAVEVGIGAVVATSQSTVQAWNALALVHLVVGLGVFTCLVVALAWTLEARTADLPSKEWEGESRESGDDGGPSPSDGPLGVARTYMSLTKPRLMWLLCLVASAGMALAAGSEPAGSDGLTVSTVVFTLLGGVLSIGASGTFNHVFEREVDKKMNRTADRPLASQEIPKRNALAFGVALAALSVVAFLQVGVLAAALGVVAIVFYSVVYTLVLKPNTVQNTVIGGAAGALPALIGWAAVTHTIGLPGLALAGVIFLWTPAHFYNLALAYKDDYAAGGFPMMPVVRGGVETRKHIVLWLGATLAGSAVLGWLADLGVLYALGTAALGAVFLYAVVRLHAERDRSAAMRAFHASNAFLGVLLIAVVLDSLLV